MTALLTMAVAAAACVAACLVLPATAKPVAFSNVLPRVNVTGDIMDAHDGSYNRWTVDGMWYYYAMGYGTCKQGGDMCHGCGYGYSWIGVWTSPDMSNGSWTLQREARDDSWPRDVSAYFRVHVVQNPNTKQYVLWVNVDDCPIASGACYLVGTSASPAGPFAYKGATTGRYPGGGDFDILVDDDEARTGYLIYTSTSAGHNMSVEMLRPDYLTTYNSAPSPPPPAPPTPDPTYPGLKDLGHGACRDAAGNEPPFFTNERGPLQPMLEAECAANCTALGTNCGGFSWCSGTGSGKACTGACHLYTDAASPAPGPSGWRYTPSSGIAGNVSTHTSEEWWRCYQHEEAGLPTVTEVAAVHDPLPTNTSSGMFGHEFVEAPAIFKRGGLYYALFGKCCCFCGHGSGIGVYTADHPLGPWSYHENIGCSETPKPGCGCGMIDPDRALHCDALYGKSITKAQQNFVMPVQTTSGTVHVWTGDMWQSASDGIKAHDLQFWTPLTFVNSSAGVPLPLPVKWIDGFTLDVV